MAWKPYKPVLEISADWVMRALVGLCLYLILEMRTDIATIKNEMAQRVTSEEVNKTKITTLENEVMLLRSMVRNYP